MYDIRSCLWCLPLALSLVACSGAGGASAVSGDNSEENLTVSSLKVTLPKGDICRPVLGSLAAGLAEGAVGIDNTQGVRVAATGEDEFRHYAFLVNGKPFSANGTTFPIDFKFDVTLDNDSASLCLVLSAKLNNDLKVPAGSGKKATKHELEPSDAPVHTPSGDDCASVLALLGKAVAVSAVGPANIVKTDVTLSGEEEVRDYVAHVDGKDFTANGKTFPNDHDFTVELDNDSASLCVPLDIEHK
jgi:hypothetical protein